jgi:23S rRNA (pseudouridine1915-N3)-methyltransferase
MKCRLIAAGTRLPDWVNEGFANIRSGCAAAGARAAGDSGRHPPRRRKSARAISREGANMLAALGRDDYVVALEVRQVFDEHRAAQRLAGGTLREAQPLALLIGGPDGLSEPAAKRADQSWSLSPLTCRMRWCASWSPSRSTGP